MKRSILTLSIFFCLTSTLLHAQLSPQPDSVPQTQGWVRLQSGTTANLGYVSSIGTDTVFVSGQGVILRSTDAGETWYSVTNWPTNDGRVKFIDDTTGFIVPGTGGSIYKTTNGGVTWRSITVSAGLTFLNAITFVSHDSGWITGNVHICQTTDAGESWSVKEISFTPNPNALIFTDSKHGFVMGNVETYPPDPHRPQAAAYEFTDNGRDWAERYSGLPRAVEALAVITPNKLIAVGDRLIAISNDAGATWDTLPPITNYEGFFGVCFPDPMHGTIVGSDGWILHSSDNGLTWIRQNSGVTDGSYLFGTIFLDSLTGYATGDNGIILKTTNGGLSWVKLSLGISTLQAQVYPLPANNTASLSYTFPQSQHVSLTLQDITGKQVNDILEEEMQTAGTHVVTFDVSRLAAGTYFLLLRGENTIYSGKLLVEHDLP